MNHLTHLKRWWSYQRQTGDVFGPIGTQHKVWASWVILGLLISFSLMRHIPALDGFARWCCEYRGVDLTRWSVLRMIGGAVYVPNLSNLFFSVVCVALALPPLERRVGAKRMLLLTACGHISGTIVSDTVLFISENKQTLAAVDTGTSVMIASAIGAIAVLTGSWKAWVIVIGGQTIDVITQHDLAASEHLIGLATCIALTATLKRLNR